MTKLSDLGPPLPGTSRIGTSAGISMNAPRVASWLTLATFDRSSGMSSQGTCRWKWTAITRMPETFCLLGSGLGYRGLTNGFD